MTRIILFALCLLGSISLFAQSDDGDEKTFHFGLGGTVSLPLSSLQESTTYGVGFEIQPSYSFSSEMEAFVQVGVGVFKSKSDIGINGNAGGILHIPMLAGVRFKTNGFFAGGGVGYGIFNLEGLAGKGFMYSPQIGYDGGSIEFGLNYSTTIVKKGSLSYIGLKIFRKL